MVNDFLRMLSQFSTNCHELLQALFPSHVATTLKMLLINIVLFKSYSIFKTCIVVKK